MNRFAWPGVFVGECEDKQCSTLVDNALSVNSPHVTVCVCVYHLNRCKTSNLQGVTGVPGGSVTNEDTSPGPV